MTTGTRSGRLVVVGTGIRPSRQITPEARVEIERADVVLHLLAEPTSRAWLESLHPDARSLHHHYSPGRDRAEIYEAMVEDILESVRAGKEVCAAFYGHPGVYVAPSHEAIRRARAEGYEAVMLPGISAVDCLFADLGIDAGDGWQGYGATDFVVRPRRFDRMTNLVLWQIGVAGECRAVDGPSAMGLEAVKDALESVYGPGHEVVIYEASPYPIGVAAIRRVPVAELEASMLTTSSTLFVPAAGEPTVSEDAAARIGFVPD